ncbi:cache domain-containing protein, partial [Pseudomonas fulva]
MNIKQKLTWAFAAIACVPVVLVAVVVVINLRAQAQDNFLDSSNREIRQIENAMNQFFDAIAQNVEYFAKSPQIQNARDLKNYISPDAPQTPMTETGKELLQLFGQFASTHPTTAYLSLANVDGTYVSWPDDPNFNSYDPRVRPWYKSALDSPGKVVRSPAYAYQDEVLMATVRTVDDSQGKNLGVISLDVSLKQLTELVKQIKLGDSGYLMLLESNGNVLVDPRDPAHGFKLISELGDGYTQLAGVQNGLVEVELGGVPYMANVWSSSTLGWRFIGLIE